MPRPTRDYSRRFEDFTYGGITRYAGTFQKPSVIRKLFDSFRPSARPVPVP